MAIVELAKKPVVTEAKDDLKLFITQTEKIEGQDVTAIRRIAPEVIAEMFKVLDTSVRLGAELKTYYNIGKVQNASGTNPVVIGRAGDTLRQVLNNLTQMDEEQPTITQAPAITALSFSSDASDEQGTEITEVNYTLSTRDGSYTYGPSPSGVSWSAFGFSGGCVAAEKTAKTGMLTLTAPYIVGTSPAVSIACSGSHSAGSVAKTNLGNDSNPVVQIVAGTKTRNGSFSKAAVTYAYSKVVPSTVPPTSGCTKQSSVASFAVNGAEFTYAIGDTIWLLTNKANAKIQTNVLGQWWDVTQYYAGTVELTQANGAVRTYHAYRTDVFTGAGSAIYRIV